MLKAWNDHMISILLASWEIYLDESISIWNSRCICPGWIFCTWKTHPFGNEWYIVCCKFSGILFVDELVEGKSHPFQAVPLEFEDLGGKTVGLLLHTMKIYFSTGRYVIIDYDFCVLKGLIKLTRKGIFACSVINNRPRLIYGG